MRNQKGITLITLMLTIVLIFILGAVGVYTGIESFKTIKVQKFMAQMRVIQERVNVICDDWKNWEKYNKNEPNNLENYIKETLKVERKNSPGTYDIPKKASASLNPEFNDILTTGKTSLTDNDIIISNYFHFSPEELDKFLGLKDIDLDVIINFSSRNFVDKTGVESIDSEGNSKTYYVLDELIEAQRLTATIIENQIKDEVISDYYKYLVSHISENLGDSKKVLVTLNVKVKSPIKEVYCADSYVTNVNSIPDSEWEKRTDYTSNGNYIELNITENGNYYFKLIDANDNIFFTKEPINIELANAPVLEVGMKPISFQDGEIIETTRDDSNWYDYSMYKKEWANVMLADGSIYVWIPRFAYKIDNVNESISIKFLKDASDDITIDGKLLDAGYTVHPAFRSGITKTDKFKNGEWNQEINGIWVSKFNANMSEDGDIKTALGEEITKVKKFEDALVNCRMMETKDLYGFEDLASENLKPNLTFEEDNNKIDTHLIKNSEIGAVMYLAWSEYGNAKYELKENNTIYAGGSNVENEIFGTNVMLSTTGNASGVYDLKKPIGEYVSAGLGIVKDEFNIKDEIGSYYTIYSDEKGKNTIAGDGIVDLMTWGLPNSENNYPVAIDDKPVFIRGNNINNMFSYSNAKLEDETGFYIRPVIIVNN